MIDIGKEKILTFREAADSLPRRRAGRKTGLATLYRWSTSGCRGVRLETIQIGASRCTSRQALQRFFDALSVQGPAVTPSQADAEAQRRSQAAARELEAAWS